MHVLLPLPGIRDQRVRLPQTRRVGLLHDRGDRFHAQKGTAQRQRHLGGESGQDPCGSIQARPDGLHHRDRVPPAQKRADHHHDGLQEPRRYTRRRHGDRQHHRALWRVPDRQKPAVPHPCGDVPATDRHGWRGRQVPFHRHGRDFCGALCASWLLLSATASMARRCWTMSRMRGHTMQTTSNSCSYKRPR
ncbi:hypothetical protein K437DRAFT_150235 [Tilletiaria anomala UBC 951]|uniref:Uncharacterized protein n=1 Tax=Tilletiaria anomala (strain ATCC 24038 / CBS 436.72 / UBC 951) TaxID=1037660 RepID=A0A066WPG3_TILAU|nr:uncharacterized protein K437DRAFT_150235 [Tilletiaria anomala UBC 951]KDN52864.1 hypothetical protein K437DRAFT_150235 [Tilletiaria anomala UBC 951]